MIPRIYSQDHPGRLWQTLGTSVTYIYIYIYTILLSTVWVILIGELFLQIFDIFFAQFFNLPYFPGFFFPIIGMLTNLIFLLLLENFTNSDRTPPYIDTYLQLFPHFGKFGKKRSPIRMSLRASTRGSSKSHVLFGVQAPAQRQHKQTNQRLALFACCSCGNRYYCCCGAGSHLYQQGCCCSSVVRQTSRVGVFTSYVLQYICIRLLVPNYQVPTWKVGYTTYFGNARTI